ncbi:MAG: hypothetical protein JNL90_17170 [Planctomycetes bacterium]|nr:hypothetical protein [Planctomycetota bacterium]
MKTILRTGTMFVMLAASAFASKWTPTGGETKNPAPEGKYVGSVSRTSKGGVTTWKITTDKGVLEVDSGDSDLSDAEQETLDLAVAQNDKDNTVEIDKHGDVNSVSTG